jgi:hypothetical protein
MIPATNDTSAPIPPYTLRWTCSDAGVDMSVGSRALLSSPTSANLVLAAHALSAGRAYTFTLTLSSTDVIPQTTWASVDVVTSRLPSGGACTLVPLPGDSRATMLSAVYSSECTGWLDAPENLPLSFAWSLVDARTNASIMTLQSLQTRAAATLLLPAGAVGVGAVTPSEAVQVTVRNAWGGEAAVVVPRLALTAAEAAAAANTTVNVTSPDSIAAASAFGVSAIEQASRSGSLNDMGQVR